MDISERFWSKVCIKEPNECWEWQASTSGGRYGKFKLDGKWVSAHRMAYILSNDYIESNMYILHKCDNIKCVNPSHLYSGTQADNMRDRNERNPTPPETAGYGKAKLYSGELWLLRKLKGRLSTRCVGKMFKINQMTVIRIWRAIKWLCKEGYYA